MLIVVGFRWQSSYQRPSNLKKVKKNYKMVFYIRKLVSCSFWRNKGLGNLRLNDLTNLIRVIKSQLREQTLEFYYSSNSSWISTKVLISLYNLFQTDIPKTCCTLVWPLCRYCFFVILGNCNLPLWFTVL